MKRLTFEDVVKKWEEKARYYRVIGERASLKPFMTNYYFGPDFYFIFDIDEYIQDYKAPAEKQPLQFVTTEIEKIITEHNLSPGSETLAFFSTLLRYMLCAQMHITYNESILDEDSNHFSTNGVKDFPFGGPYTKIPSKSFSGKEQTIFQLEPVGDDRFLISFSKSGRLLSVIEKNQSKSQWLPKDLKKAIMLNKAV